MTVDREQKTCPACLNVKTLSEFNRRASARDGLQSWCRECQKAEKRRYRLTAPTKPRDPEAMREHRKRWINENREKRRAQRALQAKVRRGSITRPDRCESCDKEARVEAHHNDYARRFDVLWLCATCHRHAHAEAAA